MRSVVILEKTDAQDRCRTNRCKMKQTQNRTDVQKDRIRQIEQTMQTRPEGHLAIGHLILVRF